MVQEGLHGTCHSTHRSREPIPTWSRDKMSGGSVEKKALSLLAAVEQSGREVTRIVVDGRKIELVIRAPDCLDEFDRVDMRHGKT